MIPRNTARGIVLYDDKILLIERWRGDKHYFSVPGGGIESDETAEQACLRELLEETGCDMRIARQIYMLETADGSSHAIFLCEYLSGTPHLPADSPEALARDSDNRFKPAWIPLGELETVQFMVWEPIRRQLLHDLSAGFSQKVIELTADVIP